MSRGPSATGFAGSAPRSNSATSTVRSGLATGTFCASRNENISRVGPQATVPGRVDDLREDDGSLRPDVPALGRALPVRGVVGHAPATADPRRRGASTCRQGRRCRRPHSTAHATTASGDRGHGGSVAEAAVRVADEAEPRSAARARMPCLRPVPSRTRRPAPRRPVDPLPEARRDSRSGPPSCWSRSGSSSAPPTPASAARTGRSATASCSRRSTIRRRGSNGSIGPSRRSSASRSWAWRSSPGSTIATADRCSGRRSAAVVLVGFQAWLGRETVRLGNSGESVTAHLAAAMLLVALLVFVTVRAGFPARLGGCGRQPAVHAARRVRDRWRRSRCCSSARTSPRPTPRSSSPTGR